jgi:hypothetical protein
MIGSKTHALRFRIWQYCRECEWNTTTAEIAEALGENRARVGKVVGNAGWTHRLRATKLDYNGFSSAPGSGFSHSSTVLATDFDH